MEPSSLSPLTVLLLLLPVVLVQLGLQVLAAIDLGKRKRVRGGNKWVWVVIILLGILGALAYFAVGRLDDDDAAR